MNYTSHAKQRLCKRLRVKGDLDEHIMEVLRNGVHRNNTTGVLRTHLDNLQFGYENSTRDIVVYKNCVYIFSPDAVLITAWKMMSEGELKTQQHIRENKLRRTIRYNEYRSRQGAV